MESRKKSIYNALFMGTCSKLSLVDICEIGIKSIENTIKTCDDIVYSKKLGVYYFKDLLPSYISFQNYLSLFKESFASPILKSDMLHISTQIDNDFIDSMINTSELSILSKNIIRTTIAIHHNCILKVSYKGNKKDREIKYIQPNQIFITGTIYYLSLRYDKKNKDSVGKERTFAFNSIEDIEPIEYITDTIFETNVERNAFGKFSDAKQIRLKLTGASANYFKREGLFKYANYTFISEGSSDDIEIKMLYNNKIEVVKLLQQWMPQIKLADITSDTDEIRKDIENNFKNFMEV